jgi:E3 ubiquitin-protein ligase HECTD1
MGNLINSKIDNSGFSFSSNLSKTSRRADFQKNCELYILALHQFGRLTFGHFPDDIVHHIMSFVICRLTFSYAHDFDDNGILYYLGTQQYKTPYEHPETLNQVKIRPDKFYCGTPQQAFSHNMPKEQNWLEKAQPDSFMEIEFLNYAVMPSAYTIRHGYPIRGHAIRNWRFEAKISRDDLEWVVLRHHKNDTTIQGIDMNETATFFLPEEPLVQNKNKYFKIFRIYQDGQTESNSCYLMISGFELYGHLVLA